IGDPRHHFVADATSSTRCHHDLNQLTTTHFLVSTLSRKPAINAECTGCLFAAPFAAPCVEEHEPPEADLGVLCGDGSV
ncbi:MAG: hypothetical protein KJP02_08635, partial [Octadecabacter sp.]|nr:hypothetical protein [Octadecabacter sp.]